MVTVTSSVPTSRPNVMVSDATPLASVVTVVAASVPLASSVNVTGTGERRKIELTPAAPSIIVTEPGVGYRCELDGTGAG
jgi:DNA-binding response OmpR family regulator